MFSIPIHKGKTSKTENPFDLKKHVEEIMSSVNWILERIPADVPLIILMGELHDVPTHIALQQAVLAELVKKGERVSYGDEFPHNLDPFLKEPLPNNVLEKSDREKILEHFMQHGQTSTSPFTKRQLMSFCHTNGVSYAFNDLAQQIRPKFPVLNIDDPKTRAFLKKETKGQNPDINYASPLGAALRNKFIVQEALAHMEATNARVYVQSAGVNHIFSIKNKLKMRLLSFFNLGQQHSYADSLDHIFKQSGCAVLTVYPFIKGLNDKTPKEAANAFNSAIKVEGLKLEGFNRWSETGTEEEFWHKINAASNRILEP